MSLNKPSALRQVCVTILFSATFFSHVYSQVPTDKQYLVRPSTERFLNGAFREMLRPQARQLLADVEKSYGREVRVKVMSDWENHLIGESSLEEDGTPEIRLNASTGRTEVCAVHELFHLKLKAEGYPAIILTGDLTESHRAYFANAASVIRETLQHRAFYPEMRRMGFTPEAMQRVLLKRVMKGDRDDGVNVAPDEVSLALYYFKACLEVEDRELISHIEKTYEKKQFIWGLETGKMLVGLAREYKSQSPEEEIGLLIRCLNALFSDKVSFGVRRWLRRFDIENVAVIEIIPR